MTDHTIGPVLVSYAQEAVSEIITDWLYANGRNCVDYVANLDAEACIEEFFRDNGNILKMRRVFTECGSEQYDEVQLHAHQVAPIAQRIIDDAAAILAVQNALRGTEHTFPIRLSGRID